MWEIWLFAPNMRKTVKLDQPTQRRLSDWLDSVNKNNDEFDRLTFFQNLRSLHIEDLGQIIISIPNASQKVSVNETNARKIEQLITWAENSAGSGIEKIYEVAKKLYPSHF